VVNVKKEMLSTIARSLLIHALELAIFDATTPIIIKDGTYMVYISFVLHDDYYVDENKKKR
jgi:hypothetical protein